MLSVPVFDMKGKRTGEMPIDPAWLGGEVRPRLIKQAIVAYLNHQRQRSARTKGKADTEGSTRKLYRQKGTGNARMGQVRTPVRRGGGRAFAKRGPGASVQISKKMRRLALDSAILAKMQSEKVAAIDGLSFSAPKTKTFITMLRAIGIEGGCLVALHERDRNVFLSGRNIDRTDIRLLDDLNAYEVLHREKLLFTKAALERLAKGRKERVA